MSSRLLHIFILLLILAALLFVRTQDYGWMRSLRYIAFDNYNRLYPRPESNQVSIVDIDEESLSRPNPGQWPWPRDTVAAMVQNLDDMGARAIVFDVTFPEPDRTSPQRLLEKIPADALGTDAVNTLRLLPDHDAKLAETIKNTGRVVTGFVWTGTPQATRHLPASRPISMGRDTDILRHTVTPMQGVTTNIPELEQAAAGNGNFGVSTELDGLIRKVPLLFRMANGDNLSALYPALSVEALRVAQDPKLLTKIRKVPPGEAGLLGQPFALKIGKFEIPIDKRGDFYVWFAKERSKDYIPAWKVLDKTVNSAAVAGKIILIGTSAEGLKDIRSTPLDLFIPGVEVHVNVIEQILTQAYLLRPALIEGMELMAVAAIGLVIIVAAPFLGAIVMSGFTLALIGAISLLSLYGFKHGLLIDPVFPGLSLLGLNAVSSLLAYLRAEAERRIVKDAFGLYISPDYMKELTRDPSKLKLGGQERELTVMFTDIRGFTTIAESMPSDALVNLMNDFLTPMSDLVMKNRGTIDKYMGDAMMAFWNAPLDVPDHAKHACRTALHMNEALKPINARLEAQDLLLRLQAGIGISTGRASVGNMGSKQRFAYSALGDTVNLASRLESQTKTYGVEILIGEQTQAQVKDFATLELDLLRVKGKMKPVRVFALLGDEAMGKNADFQAMAKDHYQMMAMYRIGDFAQAEWFLQVCRTHGSSKGLKAFYDLYESRIREMAANPPENWDGVFTAASK